MCRKSSNRRHTIKEFYNLCLKNVGGQGQCVIVPKRHVTNIRDLPDEEVKSLLVTVKQVSSKLKEYLDPEGFNYGFNEGKFAGQSVNHLHFHILPRFKEDMVSRHHLFHRPPEAKRNLTEGELKPSVEEFRKVFLK